MKKISILIQCQRTETLRNVDHIMERLNTVVEKLISIVLECF